uniref:Cysteine-rich secretory protein 2-like n=1 Tax=Saccoglossus kowalevskii TaxID=10224 RepID=A0ABM0ML50_SACKO|nr:PREDICTED: cysteine-rich secretory protein 2-like [Saccoglossus kowalevskii]
MDSDSKTILRDRRQTILSRHPFSDDEIQMIVDRHNELRRQVEPPASNMQTMMWHEELANMAQTWAERCVWEHGQPEVSNPPYSIIGQNMKKGTGLNAMTALDQWFAEKEFYNFDNITCTKECGHYTQVVSGRSKEVGCGVAECPSNSGAYNMVVCNYGPAGNYRNTAPYISGVACSACPPPSWCHEGLCMPDCQHHDEPFSTCDCHIKCENCGIRTDLCTCTCADGWTGITCSEPCSDTSRHCGNGWYRHWCNEDHSNVLTKCPLMCGLCQQLPEGEEEQSCCGGKICQNEGNLDVATCTCECTKDFTGDLCENPVTTPVMVEITEHVDVEVKGTEKTHVDKKATPKAENVASAALVLNLNFTNILVSILLVITCCSV